MYFRCYHDQPPPLAHLAQRMHLDVAVSYLAPLCAVTNRQIVWAFVLVVPLVHEPLVFLAILLVREVWATWESARLFRFPGHSSLPNKEKRLRVLLKALLAIFCRLYHTTQCFVSQRSKTVHFGSKRFILLLFL